MKFIYTVIIIVLGFQFLNAQNNWVWQNPTPQGYDITSLASVDSNTLVGVAGNLIIRSSDKGATWTVKSFNNYLSRIAFTDFQNGIAVGSNIILRSSDGGANWIEQSNSIPGPINDLIFLNYQNGFILNYSGNVFKTTDAGYTWMSTNFGSTNLTSISFASPTNGFIVGKRWWDPWDATPLLYKTTNTGELWEIQNSNLNVDYRIISALDSLNLVIACEGGAIIKTTDCGESWFAIRENTGDIIPSAINYIDINTIIVFNFNFYSNIRALKTTDGGKSWRQLSGISHPIQSTVFENQNEGVAVGNAGVIISTTDGGETWIHKDKRITSTVLNAVYAIDDQNAIVVGLNGIILNTTDGGDNWLIQTSGTDANLTDVQFTSKNLGYIIGGQNILRTSNGGATWEDINSYQFPISALVFSDENNAYAISTNSNGNNVILHSSDGCLTWEIKDTGLNGIYGLRTIDFFDSQNGIAAGGIGNVIKTTNGGQDWIKLENTPEKSFRKVCFADINNIYITSTSGVVRSYDGGISWETLNIDLIKDIFFPDPNNGYMVGYEIFRTTNAGATWSFEGFQNLNLLGVHFFNADEGFAVGREGSILRKKKGNTVPVELISFVVKLFNGNGELCWQTSTETNNSGFEVEKSFDGKNFNKIAFIKGAGTTTEPQSYSYTDNDISKGSKLYYRLKQIDFDGSYEYSKTIEVDLIPQQFSLSQNYPNPFNPTTTIEYSLPAAGHVLLKVYDVLGNEIATLVNEEKEGGFYSINFDAYKYASGVYAYSLFVNKQRITKKMVIEK